MPASGLLSLALLFVATAPVSPTSKPPPKGLSCLSKWYAITTELRDGQWVAVLPDGTFVPWDDGRVKTPEERLVDPDLEDLFFVPYPKGPIRPIEAVEGEGVVDEPGRNRVDSLFTATYGTTAKEVSQQLRKVEFFGKRYSFHRKATDALKRVAERLKPVVKEQRQLLIFLQNLGGTWNWRTIAKSTALSTHAWGIAIDLNVTRAHYWQWQRPRLPLQWKNKFPQEIVDAFEAEGFIWGGRWLHYDTMHFEYRPELVDSDCW